MDVYGVPIFLYILIISPTTSNTSDPEILINSDKFIVRQSHKPRLICNCTFPEADLCIKKKWPKKETICDAEETGDELVDNVQRLKQVIERLKDNPYDLELHRIRENFCLYLQHENAQNLRLLEFDEDWSPACLSFEGNSSTYHLCSMAPARIDYGTLDMEDINAKIQDIFNYAGCRGHEPNFVRSHAKFCRGNACAIMHAQLQTSKTCLTNTVSIIITTLCAALVLCQFYSI